jgi:ankyrin repeat protein
MDPSQKIKNPDLVTLVSLGSVEFVKQALDKNWDPNVDNNDGMTPILKAAERNDLKMV